MQSPACALCESNESQHFSRTVDYISGETFTVVRCCRCGLIYVNPRPEDKDLHRYYPEIHQQSNPAIYERMDAKSRIRLIKALQKSKPGRLLDVGCGKGLLLTGLRESQWEVFGTELSEVSGLYAQSLGLPVYITSVERAPFAAESFNIITLFHVLEHLTQPKETLKILYKLLKPQGLLIIEVPNIGSWYARIFGNSWFHYDIPRHLYHFNRYTLQNILQATGFDVVEEKTRNLQYDSFGAVQSVLNKLLPNNPNLLNNFNTGEVSLQDLWHDQKHRLTNLGALAASQLFLGVGFPIFAFLSIALSPWVDGGTLQFVARKTT